MYASNSFRGLLPGSIGCLVTVVLSSALVAQTPTGRPADPERDKLEATELARQASELTTKFANFGKAARLYERSALLVAPEGDLEGYASFVNAANLYYYANNKPAARRMFEAAGRLALENGEVYNAAICYVNAGLIAQETNEREKAAENGLRAQKLSNSSALTAAQRKMLTGYFQQVASATP